MLTLAKLQRLSAVGVKVEKIVAASGYNIATFWSRVRRGAPELTPEESQAISAGLRTIADEIRKATR